MDKWSRQQSAPVHRQNKQQHMASCTPLCFSLLLEHYTLLYIQLREDESRRGKGLLVRLV